MHWNLYDSRMRIELLYVADCPNVAVALERIGLALDQIGAVVTVTEVEVTTSEQAHSAGMNGSPTILVDGEDPFNGAGPSLACRLYRTGESVEGTPPVAALVEALSR